MTEIERLVLKINQQYQVGQTIRFKEEGKETESIIRFPAETTEKGRGVIWLKGYQNAIDIKNLIL